MTPGRDLDDLRGRLTFHIQVACCLEQKHWIAWPDCLLKDYYQAWARDLLRKLVVRGVVHGTGHSDVLLMIFREMSAPCATGDHQPPGQLCQAQHNKKEEVCGLKLLVALR